MQYVQRYTIHTILLIHHFVKVQDLEFLKCNKISSIVNCTGSQIENVFEKDGYKYLNLNWDESNVSFELSYHLK